jgi:uncharacterized protein YndB with AHSA1/START domain
VTDSEPAGTRILGTLRSADGKGIARMHDRFDTDIDDLWSALTDPGRLARWMGEVEGDLRVGGQFRARFFASGWEGTGRVDACEPPRRLLLTMDPGQPDEHVIEATLAADGDHTTLVWEERGMPLDQLAAYGSGIQVHVEDLADHLAGKERCDALARWNELLPAYQDLAAAIGPDHFDTLRRLGSLASVSDGGVRWMADHVEARELARGDALIRQGESTRECYFIVDGETEVRRDGAVLGFTGEGEPEGELGLFLGSPRIATTTARTPVSVLILAPQHWDRLCTESPRLAEEIRVAVCRHLARRFGLPAFAGVPVD